MSDRDGYLHRRDQLLMQDEQIADLKQQLADANERIQVLEMKVKGRNPDGTLIPATPFHQKEEGNE